jgi:4-hydroxybenzoate polyprenyltransferase
VVVTVLGIAFLIPKAVLATVVLASLTVMTAYIVQAIKDMESDRAKDYI